MLRCLYALAEHWRNIHDHCLVHIHAQFRIRCTKIAQERSSCVYEQHEVAQCSGASPAGSTDVERLRHSTRLQRTVEATYQYVQALYIIEAVWSSAHMKLI
ncbi:hypothetical protein PYW08_015418 [Mythimna loreyi]|uniref:Uncharacterized protein n=1 Tax=Mythimna loreyi TaxID=667449 RepID=A0ACC2QW51_9NEOP|nr:hypothetical protein PYW08_015418 [Mythimna loreyi]